MKRNIAPRQGFSLVELMITVAILGILAAIAIPSLTSYITRSKTAEAAVNINQMFKGAASYYSGELAGKQVTSTVNGYCTVGNAGPRPLTPGAAKNQFVADANFKLIHFMIADYVYFSYGLAGTAKCGNVANNKALYTFYANGDLDGDGTESTFELAAGTDASNILYHSRGLYVAKELE